MFDSSKKTSDLDGKIDLLLYLSDAGPFSALPVPNFPTGKLPQPSEETLRFPSGDEYGPVLVDNPRRNMVLWDGFRFCPKGNLILPVCSMGPTERADRAN